MRYHIHFRIGAFVADDCEGVELSDMEAVRELVADQLQAMRGRDVSLGDGPGWGEREFIVTAEAGAVLMRVPVDGPA